jgi:hypothetical protein
MLQACQELSPNLGDGLISQAAAIHTKGAGVYG